MGVRHGTPIASLRLVLTSMILARKTCSPCQPDWSPPHLRRASSVRQVPLFREASAANQPWRRQPCGEGVASPKNGVSTRWLARDFLALRSPVGLVSVARVPATQSGPLPALIEEV